jgi:hypothetical protein
MVKKVGLGRQFGSNGTHFGWFPARALLVSVGGELRNVFPCELENRNVEPENFLESLLKREPWATGGVERRKRVKRHDRLADHLAANPDLLGMQDSMVRCTISSLRVVGSRWPATYIPPSRFAEFAEIGITCFSLPGNLLETV